MEIESTPIEVREIRDSDSDGRTSLARTAGAAMMGLTLGALRLGLRTGAAVTRGVVESTPGQMAVDFATGATDRALSFRSAEEGFSRAVSGVINVFVEVVDPAELMEHIDLNRILATIDVNALLERVDFAGIIKNLDLNEILADLDIDALLERVDVAALAQQARIGDLVAQSTGQVADSALDLGRRQAVALDTLLGRAVGRVLGRDVDHMPAGPENLIEPLDGAEL